VHQGNSNAEGAKVYACDDGHNGLSEKTVTQTHRSLSHPPRNCHDPDKNPQNFRRVTITNDPQLHARLAIDKKKSRSRLRASWMVSLSLRPDTQNERTTIPAADSIHAING
jgi:hypothetical protein